MNSFAKHVTQQHTSWIHHADLLLRCRLGIWKVRFVTRASLCLIWRQLPLRSHSYYFRKTKISLRKNTTRLVEKGIKYIADPSLHPKIAVFKDTIPFKFLQTYDRLKGSILTKRSVPHVRRLYLSW